MYCIIFPGVAPHTSSIPGNSMEPRYVQITREAYEERRERMADRIKSMITYAISSRCRQQMLLEYFGEKSRL